MIEKIFKVLHSDSLLYSPSAAVEIVYVDYPEVDVIGD